MSRSRIIQVSRKEHYCLGLKGINEDYIYDRIDSVCYIQKSPSSREEDLCWFKKELEKAGFSLIGEKIVFNNNAHFLDIWRAEAVKAAEELDFDKMEKICSGAYFSEFVIYDESSGYACTLWEWLRLSFREKQVYYVGSILETYNN